MRPSTITLPTQHFSSICYTITEKMTAPASFKAAVVPEAGAKNVVEDRPTPSLNADEVLIKVTATAINPVDWKIRDYKLFLSEYPAILGSDAAGEIASVGSDVKTLKEGERVFFQGIIGVYPSSTFQQYVKMPAALVAKTPSNITDDEAAGVSLATVAVLTGLYDKTGHGLPAPWDKGGDKVGEGKTAFVLGGSSSVGQYAIQLARLSGFSRIVTNASATHIEHLKALGATTVLDRSKATAQDFVAAAQGTKADFVYDSISAPETQKFAVDILQHLEGGNVITVLGADEKAAAQGKQGPKAVEIKGIMGMGSNPALRYLSEPLFANLGGENGYIAKGLFKPNRPEVVPGGLANIEAALEKNKKGVSGVKVVIRPFDN